jgi:hypothetical protein
LEEGACADSEELLEGGTCGSEQQFGEEFEQEFETHVPILEVE